MPEFVYGKLRKFISTFRINYTRFDIQNDSEARLLAYEHVQNSNQILVLPLMMMFYQIAQTVIDRQIESEKGTDFLGQAQ